VQRDGNVCSSSRNNSETGFVRRSSHVPASVSELRRSRIVSRQPQRDRRKRRRRSLVRNPDAGHDTDSFPTRHLRARLQLSLDGKHRDRPVRQHGARLQFVRQRAQSADSLHRTIGHKSGRSNGSGRRNNYQRHWLADGLGTFSVGRLQLDDCRSIRRLHVLVHNRIHPEQRGV
jgi:hypothetical protein